MFNTVRQPAELHWRRQLWGTGHVPPSTYNNFFFSVYSTLTYTKSDSDYTLTVIACEHPVTCVPLLAPNPGDATAELVTNVKSQSQCNCSSRVDGKTCTSSATSNVHQPTPVTIQQSRQTLRIVRRATADGCETRYICTHFLPLPPTMSTKVLCFWAVCMLHSIILTDLVTTTSRERLETILIKLTRNIH